MATELLLMANVEDLGKAGEIVKVADGYARNYLLPKGLAEPATKNALRRVEKIKIALAAQEAEALAAAQKKAAKLADLTVTITAKSTDGVALFGSVGALEIAAAVKAATEVELAKNQIKLETPFKEVGEFEVKIRLHADVTPMIKVVIVAE